ncbi:hypothetical protein BGZ68_004110 [Mortierella alpina]|nr:hypothetical protein BGZ68_004110 [Mortierella alpina]
MPSPTGAMNKAGLATMPASAACLRTLIIDNYDSYTFNLLQLFDQDQLENVVVIRNDQFAWPQLEQEILPYFDQVILSPGPGRPERSQDFGVCTQVLQTSHIPVFGVCLGHQGIGWIHGAKVTYGPEPVHGQIAHIKHDDSGLFAGIPQEFEAVRYHSLVIQEQDLPYDLVPSAWCHSFPLITADNLIKENVVAVSNTDRVLGSTSIMGVRHRTLPHHGVQFHPESICTQFGKQMMANFFRISHEFYADQSRAGQTIDIPDYIRECSVITTKPTLAPTPSHRSSKSQTSPYSLLIRALDPTVFPDPETVFSSLFLTGPRSKAASWWLDSSRQPHPMSRFSFMGGVDTRKCVSLGPQDEHLRGAAQAVIQYSTLHKEIRVRLCDAQDRVSGVRKIQLGDSETFWDWTSEVMGEFGNESVETTVIGPNGEQRDFEEVPFDFFAGMIGYFGYEMKRESLEGYQTPAEQKCHCLGHGNTERHCTCDCVRKPDASFVLATQAVVFDHVEKRVYVLGLVNNQMERSQAATGMSLGFGTRSSCEDWIRDVSRTIVQLANTNGSPHATSRRRSVVTPKTEPYLVRQRHRRQSSAGMLSPFKVDVTEKDYLKAIQDSLDYIHEGESYEICLTTQFRAQIPLYPQQQPTDPAAGKDAFVQGDPAFDLYKILRKLNSAPFSAFLSFPTAADEEEELHGHQSKSVLDRDEQIGKLIILSSSPERFLKIGQKPNDEIAQGSEILTSASRTVEMKPIKGTVAVAKGCFCKEDEGCGVDEHDDDSSGHDLDNDEDHFMRPGELRKGGDERRRSTSDRCAEARRRENQSRVDSLSKNIKERAENLMIVDLIRNDLAHVCSSKSVRVPYLMNVESYETVHQLVTTVRGELFDHVDNTQAVRACFPPGSMTGAPKLRSVQLLDSLEHHVERGIYSGCLGYIGIPAVAASSPISKSGKPVQRKVRSAVDLAVVIRTAVLSLKPSANEEQEHTTPMVADLSVGAGGALTILSDPGEEWREVLLKSRSVVPSVLTYMHQNE